MKPTIVQRYEFDPDDVLTLLFDGVVPSYTEVEIRFEGGYLLVDFTGAEYAHDDEAEPNPADQMAADDEDESDAEEKPSNLPAGEQTDPPDEQSTATAPENAQAKPAGRKEQDALDFLEQRLVKQFFELESGQDDEDSLKAALLAAINEKLHANLQIWELADLDARKGAYMAFVDVRGEFIAWRDE